VARTLCECPADSGDRTERPHWPVMPVHRVIVAVNVTSFASQPTGRQPDLDIRTVQDSRFHGPIAVITHPRGSSIGIREGRRWR